jgi:hypothetical protein
VAYRDGSCSSRGTVDAATEQNSDISLGHVVQQGVAQNIE